MNKVLAPAIAASGTLTELRTQAFLPWTEKTWDTPDVAHDNPADQHLHASITLGFADVAAREAFYGSELVGELTAILAPQVSAIHAYDVETTLTFVTDGTILPEPRT